MHHRHFRTALLVFAVALAVSSLARTRIVTLSATGTRQARTLTGDEPSYLLLTHSLVIDGDFNLYNNGMNRDGRFFGVERCGGHIARKDPSRREAYSIHMPGLPILLAPAYALALSSGVSPRAAVCVWLNLIAAILAVQIYLLCAEVAEAADPSRAERRRTGAALWCTAAVVLTPPMIFYDNCIYPELPGALLILYAFRQAVTRPAGTTRGWIAGALAAAFLPWLSFRFLLSSVVLLWALVRRAHGDTAGRALRTFIIAAACLISLALLLSYQYHAFRSISLSAAYARQDYAHRGFMGAGCAHGLLGLFLDQGHGLLPWSPVYLLSFTGLVLLVRERPALGLWLCALALSIYLPAASFVHWWGGYAPPPRFMVAATPFLGGALCYALMRTGRRSFVIVFAVLLALSMAFGLLGSVYPPLLYRHEHLLSNFYPSLICRIFPSLLHLRRSTWLLTAAWGILIPLATFYYARPRARREGMF